MRRGLLGKGGDRNHFLLSAAHHAHCARQDDDADFPGRRARPIRRPTFRTLKDQGAAVHGGAKPTMRQQMEMHRKNEPCATCHKIMDPIGFSHGEFRRGGRMADH